MITIDRSSGFEEFDEALLTPNHSVIDNDNEHTEIKEYLLDGVVVHRSVHVHLKQGLNLEAIAASLGA
jgi:hypothetical protein